jgi:hypothetical protein
LGELLESLFPLDISSAILYNASPERQKKDLYSKIIWVKRGEKDV